MPISAVAQEGGLLALRSEVLGLELRLTPDAPVREALHFYDPVRGEYLRTYREEARAREEEAQARREAEGRLEQTEDRLGQTEGELRQTEDQLRQTQDRLREEQAARQALEDELRELRRRGAKTTRAKSPPAPHSGPDGGPFRPDTSHRSKPRGTSLLGVEISRWGTGCDCRFVQQRRRFKVYRM